MNFIPRKATMICTTLTTLVLASTSLIESAHARSGHAQGRRHHAAAQARDHQTGPSHADDGQLDGGFLNFFTDNTGPKRLRRSKPRSASRVVSRASSSALAFGVGSSDVAAEARRWIGGNPTGRSSLWCARFMNFVLERTGRRGTGSDMARSFASFGQRISGPQVGAIAIMSRGKTGGHVGVVSGIDSDGNPIIISGNHGHRVAEAKYSRGRVIAYVMP